MTFKLNEERRKANPQASDLRNPKEVWKNGEIEPSTNKPPAPESGPQGRVADAGDIGAGTPSAYGTEVAADVVGTYSKGDSERPKKP